MQISAEIKARATYAIKVRYRGRGNDNGHFWECRSEREATFAETVKDIASNQFDHTLQVIGIDVESGLAWDASREIAQKVLDDADGALAFDALDFVEHHIGVRAAQSA